MSENREVIALIDKAHKYVVELSKGERRWDMNIPARPDEDPDLVIGKALREARKVLASHPSIEVERVREGLLEL